METKFTSIEVNSGWFVVFPATGHVLCLFKEKGKNSLMLCDFLFSSENNKRDLKQKLESAKLVELL